MSKKPYIKTLPAAIALVLFLFVSFFGSEGTLICFGEDGHVAIEFADACSGSGFGLQHAGMESDSCGLCQDVQFFSGPAFTRNASHNTQTTPLISSISLALPSKEHSNKPVNLPHHSHHKTLASLHSVILLI